ncbi:MAG: radical SAM protein [Verrucomicrobiia bacterium]|jgi:radical SAM protein with 4Fe4S-binding SPASM domain
MVNVTKLFCGEDQPADHLRYGHGHGAPRAASERRPIVVWNITRTCNLRCVHCYSDSYAQKYPGELTGEQARAVIDDVTRFGVPALLFSGGEPLVRPDLPDLMRYARSKQLRLTLSTNGTLIDEVTARILHEIGLSYVGISLDGIGETNDQFRGVKGAFDAAVRAMRNCRAVGQKVGLRLTLTKRNCADLHQIFDFIEAEGVQRACFYHLVYSGRGSTADELSPAEVRRAVNIILERTMDFHMRGLDKEILTVDHHADNAYIYLKLRQLNPARAEQVYQWMKWNGGGANSSGIGISNIDTQGNVHPDQFWQTATLGNVKERPFSEIWSDNSIPLLAQLRNRLPLLKGRCGACRFKDICGGSFRVRALQVHGDPWASDPACYLTDEEIGVTTPAAAVAE